MVKPVARRPANAIVIDAEVVPSKPKTKALPAPSGHAIDVKSRGETVRKVNIPASKDKEVQNGDILNAQKPSNSRTVPPDGHVTIGLSLGATLNVGDYQSARVDVFMIRNVPDTPEDIDQNYSEMGKRLTDEMVRQSALVQKD